jgi:hypothetical protein
MTPISKHNSKKKWECHNRIYSWISFLISSNTATEKKNHYEFGVEDSWWNYHKKYSLFQIIGRFSISRCIVFVMYLHTIWNTGSISLSWWLWHLCTYPYASTISWKALVNLSVRKYVGGDSRVSISWNIIPTCELLWSVARCKQSLIWNAGSK